MCVCVWGGVPEEVKGLGSLGAEKYRAFWVT